MRFHHAGVVVESIEDYLEHSIWVRIGPIVEDPLEQARLCLAGLPDSTEPFMELIQPLNEESPTWGALQRGGGLHHLCLGVSTQREGDALIEGSNLLPVTKWQPAALFAGRAVRFAYGRNHELLELLSDEDIS